VTGQSVILRDGKSFLFSWSSPEEAPAASFIEQVTSSVENKIHRQLTAVHFTNKRVIMKFMQFESYGGRRNVFSSKKKDELMETQLSYSIDDLLHISAEEKGPELSSCCCAARVSLTLGFASYSNMAQFTIFDKGDSGVSNLKQALDIINSTYLGEAKKAPFSPASKARIPSSVEGCRVITV
jgi:hypothetical protein